MVLRAVFVTHSTQKKLNFKALTMAMLRTYLSGLRKTSKTSKHKTKPMFKTYHFYLMFIIFMSFTTIPSKDKLMEFIIREGRIYGVTWELDCLPQYREEEQGTLVGNLHYQTESPEEYPGSPTLSPH